MCTVKVPLRGVHRGVAQGHISTKALFFPIRRRIKNKNKIIVIITAGRNDHLLLLCTKYTKKKKLPGEMMNSHFTRSTSSWVYSIAAAVVLIVLLGYSM